MSYSVSELAALLGLPFHGDGSRRIVRISSWDTADRTSLVFLEPSVKRSLSHSALGGVACVIASPEAVASEAPVIVSSNPKLDFARASLLLLPPAPVRQGCHPTAAVSHGADIDEGVQIGPHVTVGAGARIRRGTILSAGVVVGDGCDIGYDCMLHPNVVLYPGAVLRNRVVLHAGVVVGADGFGYVFDGATHVKFPQMGHVIIEDDVEIGANSTIDRGSLGTTRIGAQTKIDNLVQIAHNVEIGKHVVIAAQTGISGSTIIEDQAIIGGQVGFGDHARVQKGAVIGSKAGVLPGKIVRGGEVYWGVPVRPLSEYKRLNALFGRLPEMKAEIRALQDAVARLLARLEAPPK